jgi:hypothetical protein
MAATSGDKLREQSTRQTADMNVKQSMINELTQLQVHFAINCISLQM